jgi:NADPH-dependent glutamate synthase beta subunit-like oxidoreductase
MGEEFFYSGPGRPVLKKPEPAFWEIDPRSSGFIASTIPQILEMQEATRAAIEKVLKSGAQEYHVGSRGLTRLSLKDLRETLAYWDNALAAVGPAGNLSSIQTRRGVPTDT